jgi:hypothetical protein
MCNSKISLFPTIKFEAKYRFQMAVMSLFYILQEENTLMQIFWRSFTAPNYMALHSVE